MLRSCEKMATPFPFPACKSFFETTFWHNVESTPTHLKQTMIWRSVKRKSRHTFISPYLPSQVTHAYKITHLLILRHFCSFTRSHECDVDFKLSFHSKTPVFNKVYAKVPRRNNFVHEKMWKNIKRYMNWLICMKSRFSIFIKYIPSISTSHTNLKQFSFLSFFD